MDQSTIKKSNAENDQADKAPENDVTKLKNIPNNQSTNNNKKPIYKQWWFWVIIVAVLLVIGLAGQSNKNEGEGGQSNNDSSGNESTPAQTDPSSDENTSAKSTDNSQENTSPTSSTEEDGGYKVGDTITFKDSKVTISNITRNASTGNPYVTPESNKEFIKIDISFVNTTTSKKTFYTSDWQIQDGNGVIRDIDFSATAMIENGFTSSVELAGGGKWSGSIIFEVPAGDTNLQLQYKPSLFSKTTVINI